MPKGVCSVAQEFVFVLNSLKEAEFLWGFVEDSIICEQEKDKLREGRFSEP